MRKKVSGKWIFDAEVTCPVCDDLFDPHGVEELNSEGDMHMLLAGAVNDDNGCSETVNWDFECPNCQADLSLEKMEWGA